MFDLSKYMNKPECPVSVGMHCTRNDYLICDTEYDVVEILIKDNKFYARCKYKDEFDDEVKEEVIWAYYLEEVNKG